jgi:hypothetical protein
MLPGWLRARQRARNVRERLYDHLLKNRDGELIAKTQVRASLKVIDEAFKSMDKLPYENAMAKGRLLRSPPETA